MMKVNEVYEGDCLDVMREFPDNCIDSVITDPPYGLSFMGKDWDYGLPGVAYWREALRVAKPGATLLAFGGSRTYHRLTCAIEDGGWEIRDCTSYFHDGTQAERAFMASLSEEQLGAYLELHHPGAGMGWVFGSGFPKSANIGKQLDKTAIVDCQYCNGSGKGRSSYMVFCPEHGEIMGDNSICPVCDGEAEEIEIERDPCNRCGGSGKVKGAEREVVGQNPYNAIRGTGSPSWGNGKLEAMQGDSTITLPATPLAAKFDGYGTALKPAVEYIVMAMKPMGQSFAANAEEWGVSGLWIDGCRVETEESTIRPITRKTERGIYGDYAHDKSPMIGGSTTGRWPANVIHSGEPGVLAEFDKAGVRKQGVAIGRNASPGNIYGNGNGLVSQPKGDDTLGYNDNDTSAARFFQQCPPDPTAHPEAARFRYCPKAPRSERSTPGNNHPTQKPLSLIRYLCKLTRTPTGGIVLDPFAGSGTTALACIPEGRDFILIEKEPEYAELCRRRIAEYSGEEIAPIEVKVNETETVKQMSLWQG